MRIHIIKSCLQCFTQVPYCSKFYIGFVFICTEYKKNKYIYKQEWKCKNRFVTFEIKKENIGVQNTLIQRLRGVHFAKFTEKHLCQNLIFNKVALHIRWLILLVSKARWHVNTLKARWHNKMLILQSRPYDAIFNFLVL